MATTPRTTPRPTTRFISDPVESPFPYNSPLNTPQHLQHNNLNELFSSTQLREITTIFQLFDPSLSGYLDIQTFEVMMLSLGYRVTQQEIEGLMHNIILSSSSGDQEATSISNNSIDLSMALKILGRKEYTKTRCDAEKGTKIYFRLFDKDQKGYITAEDLKRVQNEAAQLEQETLPNSTIIENNKFDSDGMVTDEFVQAIISKFDVSSTGGIDFEEFRRIVNPILS